MVLSKPSIPLLKGLAIPAGIYGKEDDLRVVLKPGIHRLQFG